MSQFYYSRGVHMLCYLMKQTKTSCVRGGGGQAAYIATHQLGWKKPLIDRHPPAEIPHHHERASCVMSCLVCGFGKRKEGTKLKVGTSSNSSSSSSSSTVIITISSSRVAVARAFQLLGHELFSRELLLCVYVHTHSHTHASKHIHRYLKCACIWKCALIVT